MIYGELAMLIALVLGLIWLAVRIRRLESWFLRFAGVGLTGLLALVAIAASGLASVGLYKLHSRSAPVPVLKVVGMPEQIQRGESLANSFCAGCHTKTGTLTGGSDLANDLPIPLGSFVSANLTPAGSLRNWSDGEIFRAIRNGVDAQGNWLFIMSVTRAGKLSDEDTHALIAYIRSLPAAGQETPTPPDRFNMLGIVMLGAGMLPPPKPVFTGVVTAPAKGPTLEYGEYILSYQDCRECHGAKLTGGVPGQLPPVGPGLSLVKDWKLEEFVTTLRTGIDPSGHKLGPQMPWRPLSNMDDDELGAMYKYLVSAFDEKGDAK